MYQHSHTISKYHTVPLGCDRMQPFALPNTCCCINLHSNFIEFVPRWKPRIKQKGRKLKVKSLFWVHIQSESSILQALTSTFPGHWAFTVHISMWISISTHWGVYSCSHAARRTNLPSQIPSNSFVERSNAVWSALLRGTKEQTLQ